MAAKMVEKLVEKSAAVMVWMTVVLLVAKKVAT